jgi:putative nucleotidyltransferase with HDIG domain
MKVNPSAAENVTQVGSSSRQTSYDRLELLYRLSQAFNSSLNLDEVLNRVIDEVLSAIRAERGFVMLARPDNTLAFQVARGIDHQTINDPDFQISRSIVERVQREGCPVLTLNAQEDDRFSATNSVVALGLRSILCVPLKIKDRVTGIVYVDNRMKTGLFTQQELELLSSIASSAAIAIENAELFNGIQQSKKDLEVAYDKTLVGWALALELRDYETKGHSLRVTEMTERLAQVMGMSGTLLIDTRRGALLHDVGKMGIPDNILLKTGPLTPDERDFMKRHTTFARDMLQQIDFLRSAIDIPYCHHEKWDGTGYPQGLSGDQIPLAARLFAVVDVWDALASNRPYRPAWPKPKVSDYIQEQTGQHFDPQVVRAFLEMTP